MKNQHVKIVSVIVAMMLLVISLAACATKPADPVQPTEEAQQTQTAAPTETAVPDETATPEETAAQEKGMIRLGGLKGPTSIGMVKLLQDAEEGKTQNEYQFQMAGSADELTPLLIKGELDVLAVPVNLGSVLYQKTEGKVQLLAINTLGVIYLVENGETVTDWNSLKGKTILATGKGSTPEYALAYLMAQNGLDPEKDVTIDWKSEPTEVVAQMAKESGVVAMLPQPFVTVAQGQVEGLRIAMDLTKEWDKLNNGSQLLTAGLIVRTEFAKEHPDWIQTFLEEYAASTEYVNQNVEDAAALVEKFDIVKAAVAKKAIPFCNIVCISGQEMKQKAEGYLAILHGQNPNAVGGKLPDEAFYYVS